MGNLLLKLKVIYLKCNRGFNRTLSIYVLFINTHTPLLGGQNYKIKSVCVGVGVGVGVGVCVRGRERERDRERERKSLIFPIEALILWVYRSIPYIAKKSFKTCYC